MAFLVRNYRSHPDIIRVSNGLFYHKKLEACGDPVVTNRLDWDRSGGRVCHQSTASCHRQGFSFDWLGGSRNWGLDIAHHYYDIRCYANSSTEAKLRILRQVPLNRGVQLEGAAEQEVPIHLPCTRGERLLIMLCWTLLACMIL